MPFFSLGEQRAHSDNTKRQAVLLWGYEGSEGPGARDQAGQSGLLAFLPCFSLLPSTVLPEPMDRCFT